MQTTESVVVDAPPDVVFPFVADLGRYPAWMPLVHAAEPSPGTEPPAWDVELRARVGPFARSKRLRMVRTSLEPGRSVEFERAETDGRDHARWALRVDLDAGSSPTAPATATTVTMHLAYDGLLWTGGVLERVLDEQVRRGRRGLAETIRNAATP